MRHPLCVAFALAALSAVAAGPVARAQAAHDGHGGQPAAGDPASAAYAAAAQRMHAEMSAPPTGDPDADFALGMIPHHRGAIEMAQIELQYGSDPELRALAERIVAAQEGEIAELEAWLARNGR